MKNRIIPFITAFAVLLSTILIAPAASAETASRVTIPFAFSANDHVFPAGRYEVILQSENFLRLVSCETGRMANLMVRTSGANQNIANGSLLFQSVRHGYQLTQVRFANTNLESELAKQPKLEREFGRNPNGVTTEIALK